MFFIHRKACFPQLYRSAISNTCNHLAEIALNSKNITNIDREKPTITQVIEPELWGKDSVNVVVVGAKDSASGLADKAYSFDDGATWQESNSKSFTSNLSGIIIKVRDKVGNEVRISKNINNEAIKYRSDKL